MDTKNNSEVFDEVLLKNKPQNLKNINKKYLQQNSQNEKTSPNQKKNINNIQMSYYFPNNNSHENSEKDSEFTPNLNVNFIIT